MTTTRVMPRAERLVTGATGAALTAVFGTVARIRPADKPLHPRGEQFHGVLHRFGAPTAWGVEWLDTAGTDAVLVRFSRAMGLPEPLPDILGLTLRVHLPDGAADLLFATTGTGPWSRFVLQPRRHRHTNYSTLMPYRTPAGPRCCSRDARRQQTFCPRSSSGWLEQAVRGSPLAVSTLLPGRSRPTRRSPSTRSSTRSPG